jgi:hypothetical protein
MKSEHCCTGLPTSTPEQNVADYERSCCKMFLTCEEPGMNMRHSLNTLERAVLSLIRETLIKYIGEGCVI